MKKTLPLPAAITLTPHDLRAIANIAVKGQTLFIELTTPLPLWRILPEDIQRVLAGPMFAKFLAGNSVWCHINRPVTPSATKTLEFKGKIIPSDYQGNHVTESAFAFELEAVGENNYLVNFSLINEGEK